MLVHDLKNEKYDTYGQFVGFKDLRNKAPSENVNHTADDSL